jgi:leucine dehydrogenase
MTVEGEGLAPDQTEQLVVVHDRISGLGSAIAIDDSTLGPAIGGVRWRRYSDEQEAIIEVRRLARVMTLKSALAGIPSGGAKSVVFHPLPGLEGAARRRVMEAFGRVVARLDGLYVPGLDMGTELDDLRTIATEAPGICLIEPSEQTAVGLFCGIAAAARRRWPGGVAGRLVLVQGVGHVGSSLAAKLVEAGARAAVSDVDAERAQRVAAQVGGAVVAPDAVVGWACDVFAPCAVGQLIDADTAEVFDCAVIAGAANDVLAHRGAAALLLKRGIDYVPDFAVNSGGVIAIYGARAGWEEEETAVMVRGIGELVDELLDIAEDTGRSPLEIAEERASERLGHRVALPD